MKETTSVKGRVPTIVAAFLFTLVTLTLGYISFGIITTLVFTSGFLGGFILWLIMPSNVSWATIKTPYWGTLFLFVVHRIEEYISKFQQELSKLTGVPVPEVTSLSLIMLLVASIGAWLAAPFLMRRGYTFGYYLMWTFFAAMGITELAHFIFPLFKPEPYSYFPGMASVFFLAPMAWWGMWNLSRKPSNTSP